MDSRHRNGAIARTTWPTHAIALGYHDVAGDGEVARPVGPGHTTLYVLTRRAFANNLQRIRARAGQDSVGSIERVRSSERPLPVLLTVDDGTAGAYTHAAAELDEMRWPGHFFVTTDWIGQTGFMSRHDIRDLRQRGHVIGSHSCSHPQRMSHLPFGAMVREWSESCAILSDIIGEPIKTASIPDGYYTEAVARAAAAAGLESLFTSEPTSAVWQVAGCCVFGRYAVRRTTPASVVGAMAAGAPWPRWQQSASWLMKKAAKRLGGSWYLKLRTVLLARNSQL